MSLIGWALIEIGDMLDHAFLTPRFYRLGNWLG